MKKYLFTGLVLSCLFYPIGCQKEVAEMQKEVQETTGKDISRGPLEEAGVEPLTNLKEKVDDAANILTEKVEEEKLPVEKQSTEEK